MELLEVILTGYKPLALSGINEIIYTPESPYQLILGTNGCGKSSLLSQLSMMPAVAGDYHEGGRKIWKGFVNGNYYVLESTIGKKSARHSFKIKYAGVGDEVELNDGGTGQVQKELVFQHTGLPSEIEDVLLSRSISSRFVNMSPAKRQEWFQVLSPVDIKEGMEVYQSFMARARQMTAVHKHGTEQIPEVSKSLLPEAERLTLEQEIQQVRELLTTYLEAKIPVGMRAPVSIEKLTTLSQEVLAMRTEDFGHFRNYGELQHAIDRMRLTANNHQANYDRYVNEFYELDRKIRSLGGVSDDELEAQRQRVELLTSRVNTYGVPGICLVSDSQAILVAEILKDRVSNLAELLVQLPVTKPEYAKTQYTPRLERIQRNEKEIEVARNRMQHLQMELRRIDTTQEVICPSCTTQFKPGIGADAKDQIMSELTVLEGRINMMRTEISDNREYVEEVDVWRNCRQNISRLLAEDAIAPYRAAIIDSPHFSVGPKNLIAEVRHWMKTLMAHIELFNLQT